MADRSQSTGKERHRENCAQQLQLLADPTRLAVMRRLMQGPRQVSELIAELRIEQSLLPHYLKKLRDARLVLSERRGKTMHYYLARGPGKNDRNSAEVDLGCCRVNFD